MLLEMTSLANLDGDLADFVDLASIRVLNFADCIDGASIWVVIFVISMMCHHSG